VSIIVLPCDVQLLLLLERKCSHADSTEVPHQSEARRAVTTCESK